MVNIKSKEFLTLERKKGDKLKKITNLDFYLTKLANIESIREVTQFSYNSATFKVNNSEFALIIPANIDLNNELSRVTKEEEQIIKLIVLRQIKKINTQVIINFLINQDVIII